MSDPQPVTALSDFESDIELLGEILDEVCRASGTESAEILAVRARAVDFARRARAGEEAAGDALEALISELDLERLELLIRSLTRWFQLLNLAEDNERIRRIRARAAREAPAPRRGSIAEAMERLAADGVTAEQITTLLAEAEIRLVMTAHPTEARRRTTIDKQARLFRELRALDDELGRSKERAHQRMRATVQELWGSDELRATNLGVLDEVRGGLVHFNATIADTTTRIYRQLEDALAAYFPQAQLAVPPLLRFGSWIGGDRDGNPFVTPEMTLSALELMRAQCLRLIESRVERVAGRLSLSERISGATPLLEPLLAEGRGLFPELAEQLDALNPEEPYRRALTLVRERVRATAAGDEHAGYESPDALLADLRLVRRSLIDGAGAYTAAGDLHDVIRQVEVFGFHFVKLDVRQHATVHRKALAEVFETLGIASGYAQLPEAQRAQLLQTHIADRRPLIPADIARFSDATRETIETFRTIRQALDGRHRGAIDAYVISGNETAADVLEVLLLIKESSLSRAGGEDAVLRIVPLFEAGATLQAAPQTMQQLLDTPVYRTALRAVGDHQEIMIGYSDSNKDVGYLASGWGAYRAQAQIAQVLRREGISWIFFHGRGGAIGRGGGPTNEAILALPPGTVQGRLKMTEQGEVLNAKYTVSEIAQRELELTVSATLYAGFDPKLSASGPSLERYERLMEEMSQTSAAMYRSVVYDEPEFVDFFLTVTPVQEVSRLRLGSRPARRQSTGGIAQLRAIPWVFSWTQARIVLPAWLGLGTALAQARERHGVEVLREMVERWPFFAALTANAEMACAKADPGIARRYVSLSAGSGSAAKIWKLLDAELALTRAELITVRGGQQLLDSQPVLKATIERRNPYVDPLSFIQVELLRRSRRSPEPDAELERLGLLAINGIASGLRNTG